MAPQKRSADTTMEPAAKQQRVDILSCPKRLIPKPAIRSKMNGPCVWWARNDLRVQDNPCLRAVAGAAHTDGREFACVFCFDPRFIDRSNYGRVTDPDFKKSIATRKELSFSSRKTNALRMRFWIQCVLKLKEELAARGTKLYVCYGKPEEILCELPPCTEVKCQSEPVSIEQSDVEDFTRDALLRKGSKLRLVPGAMSLYHPEDLPFPSNERPESYSGLGKALGWKNIWTGVDRHDWAAPVRKPESAPAAFPPIANFSLPGLISEGLLADETKMLHHLGYTAEEIQEAQCQAIPQGGEAAARASLEEWVREQNRPPSSAKTELNFFDLPCAQLAGPPDGHDALQWHNLATQHGWMRMSHYMAVGCITAREMYYRSMETPNFAGAAHRLLWREFHRLYTQKYGRKVAWLQGPAQVERSWNQDPAISDAWKKGLTGVPYVDACQRELKQTGWLAYKGRKTAAWFLIHDLGMDWRIGAFHDEEVLFDYDFAMNYGNWAVVAKVGNGGKSAWAGSRDVDDTHWDLLFKLYAEQQNDPSGAYIRRWVPELRNVDDKFIHTPWLMSQDDMEKSGCVVGRDYPASLIGPLDLQPAADTLDECESAPGSAGALTDSEQGTADGMPVASSQPITASPEVRVEAVPVALRIASTIRVAQPSASVGGTMEIDSEPYTRKPCTVTEQGDVIAMSGVKVWWARNDLRITDNPVVRLATGHGHVDQSNFAAVFCFDPRFLDRSPYGRVTDPNFEKSIWNRKEVTFSSRKTNALRARFWVQCVLKLGDELAAKGSKLHICYGKPEDVLAGLPQGSEVVCQSEPVSIEQTDVENFMRASLLRGGSKLSMDPGAMSLYHPDDLPFRTDERPECYSGLGKALGWKDIWTTSERHDWATRVRPCVPAPTAFPPVADLNLPGLIPEDVLADETKMLKHLGYTADEIKEAQEQPIPQGGEPAARGLMEEWCVRNQASMTNYREEKPKAAVFWDLPCAGQSGTKGGLDPLDWQSLSTPYGWLRVSHYMAVGCISAREIYNRSNGMPVFTGVAHRLLWREFHRLYTQKYGRKAVWLQGPAQVDRTWSQDPAVAEAWKKGLTGVPYIDACQRELQKTGWLAYKGRKTAAHFLVHDLGIDWRIGAFHDEEVLFDYDFAMNYGNWAVVAKVGNGGASAWAGSRDVDEEHMDLKFKLTAEQQNDPSGAYIRRWVPELRNVDDKYIHKPWAMPEKEMEACGCLIGRDYPASLVGALDLADPEHLDPVEAPKTTLMEKALKVYPPLLAMAGTLALATPFLQ